jgi:hypothetical protein
MFVVVHNFVTQFIAPEILQSMENSEWVKALQQYEGLLADNRRLNEESSKRIIAHDTLIANYSTLLADQAT